MFTTMGTKSLLDSEFSKQLQAQTLFEKDGMKQKDIAEQVGVCEKTISNWVTELKWIKNNVMVKKRALAKQLILQQGLQQKEAAEIVGVSEKTVGNWVKKYQWGKKGNEQRESECSAFIDGFKQHLKLTNDTIYNEVSTLMDDYYENYFTDK